MTMYYSKKWRLRQSSILIEGRQTCFYLTVAIERVTVLKYKEKKKKYRDSKPETSDNRLGNNFEGFKISIDDVVVALLRRRRVHYSGMTMFRTVF